MPSLNSEQQRALRTSQATIEEALSTLEEKATKSGDPASIIAIYLLKKQVTESLNSDIWREASEAVTNINFLLSDSYFFPKPQDAIFTEEYLTTIKDNLNSFLLLRYPENNQKFDVEYHNQRVSVFPSGLEYVKTRLVYYTAIEQLMLALQQLNTSHDGSPKDPRITNICSSLKEEMKKIMTSCKEGYYPIEQTSAHTRIHELFKNAKKDFKQEQTLWVRIRQLFLDFFVNLRLKLKLIDTPTAQAEIDALKPVEERTLNHPSVQEKLSFFNSLKRDTIFSYPTRENRIPAHASTSLNMDNLIGNKSFPSF